MSNTRWPIIFVSALFVFSLVFNFNGLFWSKFIYPYYHLSAIIIVICALRIGNRGLQQLNYFDLAIVAVLLYTFVTHSLRIGHAGDITNLTTFALILYYLLLRSIAWNTNNISLYFSLLSIIGGGLSIYVLCEAFNLIDSGDASWPVTGNFTNPGPVGCFLALMLAAALFCVFSARKGGKNRLALLYGSLALVILITIPFTGSRTATIVALFVIVFFLYTAGLFRKPLYFVLLIPWVAGIFFIKDFDSVEGRILIWKVSMSIFEDHYVTGIGHDFFGADFMKYQAAYFASGEASGSEVLLAGNTDHAFNEFIKYAIENGVSGLLVLIPLAYTAVMSLKRTVSDYARVSSLAVLFGSLLVALFSYPLFFLCFKLLLLNQAALLSTNTDIPGFRIRKALPVLAATCTLAIALYGTYLFRHTLYWKKAYISQYDDEQYALQLFRASEGPLKTDGAFLYQYGSFLDGIDLAASVARLEACSRFYSAPRLYNRLGAGYEKLRQVKKAEDMYLRTHYCIPVLLRPQLQLMDFYLREKQYTKALYWGNKVLTAPVKIENEEARKIRDKVKERIRSISLQN